MAQLISSTESTKLIRKTRTNDSGAQDLPMPYGVGKYRNIRKLGHGGVGTVYLAQNELTSEKVAIKFLHKKLASDREARSRFYDEYEILHDELSHPNILKALEYGADNQNIPYIVFEYLDGQPLSVFLAYQPYMDLSLMLRFVVQISSALQEVHEKEIIHRDIKPENIFIVPVGQKEKVKLIDFGYSKKMGNNWKSGRAIIDNEGSSIFGTPSHMAPELFEVGKFDQTVDFYALGVVMYKMIANTVPFRMEGSGKDGISKLFEKHRTEIPQSLVDTLKNRRYREQYLDDFGAEYLNNIVQALLSKNPADRFQSGHEIITYLRHRFEIDE